MENQIAIIMVVVKTTFEMTRMVSNAPIESSYGILRNR